MDKQVFASVEISGNEIRMIVGELFNNRFNILFVKSLYTKGIENTIIINEELVVNDLKTMLDQVKNSLKVPLKKILVCIPSKDVERHLVKVKSKVENDLGIITINEIETAIKKAVNAEVNTGSRVLVNAYCTKFHVNGMTTRKIPVDERCKEFYTDVDLYFANRKSTIDIIKLIEKSGLEISSIFLDTYACGKELMLFGQSLSNPVLMIKLEKDMTSLSIYADGHLSNVRTLNLGFEDWYKEVYKKYQISEEDLIMLMLYGVDINSKKHKETPIHVWHRNDNIKYQMNEKEMYDLIIHDVSKWTDELLDICEPILKNEKLNIIVVGAGAEITNIDKYLTSKLDKEVKVYIPDIIGARNSKFTATLGVLFAYRDLSEYKLEYDNAFEMQEYVDLVKKIDEVEFNKTVKSKEKYKIKDIINVRKGEANGTK